LKTQVEARGATTIVAAEGRLDFRAAAAFQEQLETLLAAGAGRAVLLDCAGLDYVSSAGLRALLVAARAAQRFGSSFALCALRPAVREVLELSGFSRILTVHADRDAALAPADGGRRRISVAGAPQQLPVLTQFLMEFWSSKALPAAASMAFELALEEVFTNIVTHGSPGGARREVAVSLHLEAGELAMTIEDDGPEFNPLTLPLPDLEAPLAERPVGGQGVSLLRQMMGTVTYRRVGSLNQLTMTKRIAPRP
jgi:serine/threonine-protein kinase RsbW